MYMYKSKIHWQELVKKFLTLPLIQHDKLTKDLELEDMSRTQISASLMSSSTGRSLEMH